MCVKHTKKKFYMGGVRIFLMGVQASMGGDKGPMGSVPPPILDYPVKYSMCQHEMTDIALLRYNTLCTQVFLPTNTS